MNVAVLSGLDAAPPATTNTEEQGFFAKIGAWMKANPGKAGLAIGSVVLFIFLIWWFNRKPKKKRTSGLAGTKPRGKKTRSNRRSKRRKSTRKKKVNGLSGLSETEIQALVGLAKAPKRRRKSTGSKSTSTKSKSTKKTKR